MVFAIQVWVLGLSVELIFASISLEFRRQDTHPIMKCKKYLDTSFFSQLIAMQDYYVVLISLLKAICFS